MFTVKFHNHGLAVHSLSATCVSQALLMLIEGTEDERITIEDNGLIVFDYDALKGTVAGYWIQLLSART